MQLAFSHPAGANTVVVMVVYGNHSNYNNITLSGMNATWVNGYAPNIKKGFGAAFFYATVAAGQNTITTKFQDNVTALAEEWTNLSLVEDKRARKFTVKKTSKAGTTSLKIKTKNDNDVIFNVMAYLGAANGSPPTASVNRVSNFLFMGSASNTITSNNGATTTTTIPYILGSYQQTTRPGIYTASYRLNAPGTALAPPPKPFNAANWSMALETAPGPNQIYVGTPLTDYAPGQLYEGTFQPYLYNGSNDLSVASPLHDADGRSLAAGMQPLDSDGTPDPVNGKIVMVGLGPSNFTEELCTGSDIVATPGGSGPFPPCDPGTFIDRITQLQGITPSTLNPRLVVVDCAKGGQFIQNWVVPTTVGWTSCLQTRLQPDVYNVTAEQVQVLTYWDDDGDATYAMSAANPTCPAPMNAGTYPPTASNACEYEFYLGILMRLFKQQFPNLKMIFLQAKTYGGYAAKEPIAYENAFGVKWLIQAQIAQMGQDPGTAGGQIDPVAGDLGYVNSTSSDNSTVWMGWGPYLWGSGSVPRADGNSWPGNLFAFDGIHPSQCLFYGIACGREHSAGLMMDFYADPANPYTAPWFLAQPAS